MVEQRIRRRLAAIMAADVAGYSRLMGDNEAGTLAQLKECRTEIIDPNCSPSAPLRQIEGLHERRISGSS
jgi:hypothetical protein